MLTGVAASLALAQTLVAQTVTALADNRSGTTFASNGLGDPVQGGYAITPRTLYDDVDYLGSAIDGIASASIDSQSGWLGLGAGNSTTGFSASAALDVALGGPGFGSCNASEHLAISFSVSGVPGGQTVPFGFQGSIANTFSSATIHLTGPGINITHANSASWGQVLQLGNGTYTLTIDAATGLNGFGPDVGNVDYSVSIERIPTAPTNDDCSSPLLIGEGTIPVSITNATGSFNVPTACTQPYAPIMYNEVFYRYVAPATGVATISTCELVDFDSILAAFTGPCSSPNIIACSDDACDVFAEISFPTVCGEAYTIVLGSYWDKPVGLGSGSMVVTQTGGCFDPDACSHAFNVNPGQNNVTNFYDWASDVVLPATCGLGGDSTIHRGSFWTFEAPASGQVTITTCETPDSTVDSRLAVFTGGCQDPQWIACNDNSCGVFSTVSFYATCGETFTVVVGTADGSIGNWTLTVNQAGTPCNDACNSPKQVFLGHNTVTNVGATGETVVPAACGGQPMVISKDVFYTYVAEATGTATVSTCGLVNFNSRIAVYTGSCAAPTWVACNDDAPDCHYYSSTVSFPTTCFETYTIVLGETPDFTGSGSGQLLILQSGGCPDTCSGAAPLSLGVNMLSTIGMSGVSTLPPECFEGFGLFMYNDAFYTYTATVTGTVTLSTCNPGTDFDTRLAVYDGTCGAPQLIGCNDDVQGCGVSSVLSFPATCGDTYIVQLGSYDDLAGHAVLTVAETGTCPAACPGDFNQSGSVGADDIAILLGAWGGPGPADLDGNGTVGSPDLAILLGAWGACP